MKGIRFVYLLLVCAVAIASDYAMPRESRGEEPRPREPEMSVEKRFDFAKECAIAGKKYIDDKMKENEKAELPFAWWYRDVEYHYNARLNTCLVFYTFTVIHQDGKMEDPNALVVDVFSNKTLLNVLMDKLSPESFAIQKEALFRE